MLVSFVSVSFCFAEEAKDQVYAQRNFVPAGHADHLEDSFISTIGINHSDGTGFQLWVNFTAGDMDQNTAVINQYANLLKAFKKIGYFQGKGDAEYMTVGVDSNYPAFKKGGNDYELLLMPIGPSVVWSNRTSYGHDRSEEIARGADSLTRIQAKPVGLSEDQKEENIKKLPEFEKEGIDYFGPVAYMSRGKGTYSIRAFLEVGSPEQNIKVMEKFNSIFAAFKNDGYLPLFKEGEDDHSTWISISVGVAENQLYQPGETISIYPIRFGEIEAVVGDDYVDEIFDVLKKNTEYFNDLEKQKS